MDNLSTVYNEFNMFNRYEFEINEWFFIRNSLHLSQSMHLESMNKIMLGTLASPISIKDISLC